MYTNEVEKRHIERDRGLEMVKALAESKAQPRETSQVCSDAEIRSLNVRRADTRFVRVSSNYDWNGCGDFRRLIPVWPRSIDCSVQLDELREVNVCSKIF